MAKVTTAPTAAQARVKAKPVKPKLAAPSAASKKAIVRAKNGSNTRSRTPVIKSEQNVSPAKMKKALEMLDKMQKKNPKKAGLVKDVFAGVFNDLQHLDAFSLKVWAMKNPTAFYTLAAKLIPIQVSGEGGGDIKQTITFR